MRSLRRFVAALCVAFACALSAEVLPISDAERAAVEIAADYLSRGPAAVAERLASTAPLRKLTSADQLADIEVRLGPPRGAQWELHTASANTNGRTAIFSVNYPAGFEDHVAFDLVREGNVFRVQDVRFLALPSMAAPAPAPTPAATPAPAPAAQPTPLTWFLGIGCVVLVLAVAVAVQAQRRKPLLAFATAMVVAIVAGGLLFLRDRRGAEVQQASAVARPEKPATLAPLLPLRRALCDGTGDVSAAHRGADRAAGRGAIADLWKIQSDLLQNDAAAAKAALAKFRTPLDRPLAELLRARLALLENDDITAALAFERALELSDDSDALRLESAQLLYALGFEDRAKEYFEKLAALGSREADVYYSLASLAMEDSREDDAEKRLRQAWTMRPVERERLVAAGEFWSLVRKPAIATLIGFSAPAEPLVISPAAGSRVIALPPSAEVHTSGEYLQIAIGEQQLRVAGGAALVPGGVTVEATEWAELERRRRLADLPSLLSLGRNASAYSQPAVRERISGTAEVLAARNRWSDLVSLTEGLTPSSEHVPPMIFYLRSIGLQRVHRDAEARDLLAAVASSRVLQRRRDANALAQLAELLAGHDLHDAAVKMYDRSLSIRPNPAIDDRVRQIQMNKRLATRYSTQKTQRFEIHYPEDMSQMSAMRVGEVLEEEYKRLLTWVPGASDMPVVVVNILWWQDFRSTYTGTDFILGFFNGKITLPFAGISIAQPEVRAILAHELSHAMIAHATNNQAPHWFQEGLAQRVQGSRYSANALNMYDDDKLLPLALVDAVLTGSPDPEMIGAGYLVAQTNIRFLEDRYGAAAIRKMMTAFRDGATTSEAIRTVSGKSMPEIEQDLRQWGRSEIRVFEN